MVVNNVVQQDIVVRIRALTTGFKIGMASGNKSIRESVSEINRLRKVSTEAPKQMDSLLKSTGKLAGVGANLGNIFQNTVRRMGEAPGAFRNFSTAANSFGQSISGTARNLVRFRMEMLSVLFFGFALSAMMFGLVRPAGTLTGVFQLLGTILELFFLPVMLALLPVLLDILDWVISTPDEVKLLIGQIVLLAGVLGTGLALFGQMILFLPALGSILLDLVGSVSGLFGPFAGLAEGLLIISGGAIAVEGAFKLWDLIGPIVDDVWDSLKQSKVFIDVLKTFGLTVEDLKNPFEIIKEVVSDSVGSIAESLGFSSEDIEEWKDKATDFIDQVKGGIKLITDIIDRFKENFKTAMSESGASTDDVIKSLTDFIVKVIELIPEVAKLLPGVLKLTDNFIRLSTALLDIIGNNPALVSMFKGILNMVNDMVTAIGNLLALFTGGERKELSSFSEGKGTQGLTQILDFIKQGAFGPLGQILSGGVPAFANGGLVTKPTLALVGENGPEVITPLGQTAGGVSGGINITVNANTAGGVTADEIANLVESRLGDELRRLNFRL